MIGNREHCLDPWHGFFIIVAVCLVILLGISNEFSGAGRKHHKAQVQAHAMTPAAFAKSSPVGARTVDTIAF